jgi:hypothetical protein
MALGLREPSSSTFHRGHDYPVQEVSRRDVYAVGAGPMIGYMNPYERTYSAPRPLTETSPSLAWPVAAPLAADYRLVVYLAGGMRSDWQDKVIDKCRGLNMNFLDPRRHGLKDPILYTTWDMQAIQRSDVVLAFLEYDNPSGLGMAAEIGYAKGLGLPVIFVNEQHIDHNTAFLEIMCLGYYDNLTKGIDQLVAYYRNVR